MLDRHDVRLEGLLNEALDERTIQRDRFDSDHAKRRVADLVEDWSPLLALTAIQQLQADLVQALARLGLPIYDRLSTSPQAGTSLTNGPTRKLVVP